MFHAFRDLLVILTGETEPDDAIDAGETGAEARSERGGQ